MKLINCFLFLRAFFIKLKKLFLNKRPIKIRIKIINICTHSHNFWAPPQKKTKKAEWTCIFNIYRWAYTILIHFTSNPYCNFVYNLLLLLTYCSCIWSMSDHRCEYLDLNNLVVHLLAQDSQLHHHRTRYQGYSDLIYTTSDLLCMFGHGILHLHLNYHCSHYLHHTPTLMVYIFQIYMQTTKQTYKKLHTKYCK